MSKFYKWKSGFVDWVEGDTAHISAVFSWNIPEAYEKAVFYQSLGYNVRAGGPAVSLNSDYLSGVANCSGKVDALKHHNPNATFTSRGCIRKCKFCAVPKIEGDLVELDDWEPKPIVCDNNFLACSDAHIRKSVDRLAGLKGVDFNQGLDARLLTDYHIGQLQKLDLRYVRLAWDNVGYERHFMRAFEMLTDAGFPASKVRVYVLIGFTDTPEDAVYRLETIKNLGAFPAVMRYQPLDALHRNQYVGEHWTNAELIKVKSYYDALMYYGHIPFEDFRGRKHNTRKPEKGQLALGI